MNEQADCLDAQQAIMEAEQQNMSLPTPRCAEFIKTFR